MVLRHIPWRPGALLTLAAALILGAYRLGDRFILPFAAFVAIVAGLNAITSP